MIRFPLLSAALLLMGTSLGHAGAGYERAHYDEDQEWSYEGVDYTQGGYDTRSQEQYEAVVYEAPVYAVPARSSQIGSPGALVDLGPIEQLQPELNGSIRYQLLPPAPPAQPSPQFGDIPAHLSGGYVVTTQSAGIDFAPSPRDMTPEHRERLRALRLRIEMADERGDLDEINYAHLREGIREIRHALRDMRGNDGVIDLRESDVLGGMLDRHEARIARHEKPVQSTFAPI